MKKDGDVINQQDKWNDFYVEKVKGNFLKWPNEPMLKCLFGNYSSKQFKPDSSWKVLDIGCGFGNNLIPFLDIGCECHGVEIDSNICTLTSELLNKRGFKANIQFGSNRSLPYDDDYFDLLLSVATIHYEGTEENIINALKEFRRVLKPGGILYVATAGPNHDIFTKAQLLGNHRYKIQNYDFRNGQEFFFFDNVEVGQVTEELFSYKVDHLVSRSW